MKVLILGAGVQGIATAYFLARRGHEVEVIDRTALVAEECSFANGGQLSYSHAEPWASPHSLYKAVTKWLWQKDAPLQMRFARWDPDMWKWLMRFLRQCTRTNVARNTEALLRLGLYSRTVLRELQESMDLEFFQRQEGILHVFSTQKNLDAFIRQSTMQEQWGAPFSVLSPDACVQKDGALAHIAPTLAGGVYYPLDESGDVMTFTRALAQKVQKDYKHMRVTPNVSIVGLHAAHGQITGVETDRGMMKADAYVMALGSYSPLMLRALQIKLPIYPMKGYSITIPDIAEEKCPHLSITHQAYKLVYSRLGSALRVAGTAEFAGYDTAIDDRHIQHLMLQAQQTFPGCGDVKQAQPWACLRPSTPDGPPILGRCRYKNLLLNTGHGTLGWTQAAGSARIVVDLLEGRVPEIALDGLTLERFL